MKTKDYFAIWRHRAPLIISLFIIFVANSVYSQTNWSDLADTTWPVGYVDNTSAQTFEITTPEQLAQLAVMVNHPSNPKTFEGKTVVLKNSINLGGYNWIPIGYNSGGNSFLGTFLGENNEIKNLTIKGNDPSFTNPSGSCALFGHIKDNARIEDVVLKNVDIKGKDDANSETAALVAYIQNYQSGITVIKNCHVLSGNIEGGKGTVDFSVTGGLIGEISGQVGIESCSNGAHIKGWEGVMSLTGGIAGSASLYEASSISSCVNKGNITGGYFSEESYTGGIVGFIENNDLANFKLQNCFSSGNITAGSNITDGNAIGGIIGSLNDEGNTSFVRNCYVAGNINGGDYTGGIIGSMGSSGTGLVLENCLAMSTNLSGDGDIHRIVALNGDNTATFAAGNLQNNYALDIPHPTQGSWVDNPTGLDGANWNIPTGTWNSPVSSWEFSTDNSKPWLQETTLNYLPILSTIPAAYQQRTVIAFSGLGTESSPFIIKTRADLEILASSVNNGNTFDNIHFSFEPSGDILDMGSTSFVPIGKYRDDSTSDCAFQGVFHGNNKTITKLKVDGSDASVESFAIGLFGYLGGNAKIENLTLSDINIQGSDVSPSLYHRYYSGGLVGFAQNDGTNTIQITNCHIASGDVKGGKTPYTSVVGGLIGKLEGLFSVTYSSNSSSVTGNETYDPYSGGLIGAVSPDNVTTSIISDCYNQGNITDGDGQSDTMTGGILGLVSNDNTNCMLSIRNCYNDGAIISTTSSNDNFIGGLVGCLSMSDKLTIDNCYAAGSIEALQTVNPPFVGGIVGLMDELTKVSNCLAIQTNINASGDMIHRIVGLFDNGILTGNYAYIPGMEGTGSTYLHNNVDGADWTGKMNEAPITLWDQTNTWIIDDTEQIMPKIQGFDQVIQTDIPNPLAGLYHTVTFNSQGGTTVAPITTAAGSVIDAPAVPTRTNYTFSGWYKEPACINVWTFGTGGDLVTQDTVLYAKWIEQTPPEPVYYSITIPQVEGIIITPGPGTYQVKSEDQNFLNITPLDGFSIENMQVYVNGTLLSLWDTIGETYYYDLGYINEDTDITIIGVEEKNTTGITDTDNPNRIYTEAGNLLIETDQIRKVRIYTIGGLLYKDFNIAQGINTIPMPDGIYLVVIDEKVKKVVIK